MDVFGKEDSERAAEMTRPCEELMTSVLMKTKGLATIQSGSLGVTLDRLVDGKKHYRGEFAEVVARTHGQTRWK